MNETFHNEKLGLKKELKVIVVVVVICNLYLSYNGSPLTAKVNSYNWGLYLVCHSI